MSVWPEKLSSRPLLIAALCLGAMVCLPIALIGLGIATGVLHADDWLRELGQAGSIDSLRGWHANGMRASIGLHNGPRRSGVCLELDESGRVLEDRSGWFEDGVRRRALTADEAQTGRVRARGDDLLAIAQALIHCNEIGVPRAPTLGELIRLPETAAMFPGTQSAILDPWGNPYEIHSLGAAHYLVASLGKDRRPGGTGDDADLTLDVEGREWTWRADR